MPRRQGMPILENSEVMHQDVLIAVSSSLKDPTWHADVSHDQMTLGHWAEILALGLDAVDNVIFPQLGSS